MRPAGCLAILFFGGIAYIAFKLNDFLTATFGVESSDHTLGVSTFLALLLLASPFLISSLVTSNKARAGQALPTIGSPASTQTRPRIKLKDFIPEILLRDGDQCSLCGSRIDLALKYPDPMSRSVDHIVPYSKGGADVVENLRLTHLRCNQSRGNTTEWGG